MRKLVTGELLAAVIGAVLVDAVEGSADRHRSDGVEAETLSLRRQYNAVAAAADTIMRQIGRDRVDELTDDSQLAGNLLPNDAKLVLLFWADDEAELFLNGTPGKRYPVDSDTGRDSRVLPAREQPVARPIAGTPTGSRAVSWQAFTSSGATAA